jgi:hypothetical protein
VGRGQFGIGDFGFGISGLGFGIGGLGFGTFPPDGKPLSLVAESPLGGGEAISQNQ